MTPDSEVERVKEPEVEYREMGVGPCVVMAAGSCSTGAAWKGVVGRLRDVRAVTTSVCGYGKTAERRTDGDRSIMRVAEALEEVVRRTDEAVHLVGHSFGGLASLAVALRRRVDLLSLTIFEAPAPGALMEANDRAHLSAFQVMTSRYKAAYLAGDADAIGRMMDFYGGEESWAAMPEPVRTYARMTTPVNFLDWESAYSFVLDHRLSALADLEVTVVVGERSHPAVKRANALVARRIPGARFTEISGAAHFMISTHPADAADIIAEQVRRYD